MAGILTQRQVTCEQRGCDHKTPGGRKPDPDMLRLTIVRAGGDTGHAVMVGDSMTDVATARAAGIPVWRLGLSVLLAGLLMVPVAIIVGEYLAPPLTQLRPMTAKSA